MKNICLVLFFFISINVFCQGINTQPNEIRYVPIESLNTNNRINILDIDDYISILNEKKIKIVFITDYLFAFESNSVIYTISRNGYKTLTDFSDSKKKKFRDSLSYYTALELNLTSQEELDNYHEEDSRFSYLVKINNKDIYVDLVYPAIALRSGIEGRVILELFVDEEGNIRRVLILREDPPNRGFGEAAVKAFVGRKVEPAKNANGEAVSARYRYPVTFKIK